MRSRLAAVCIAGAALAAAGCADDDPEGIPDLASGTVDAPAPERTVLDETMPGSAPAPTTAPSADPNATTPTTRTDAGQPPHPSVTRPYSAGRAGRVLIAQEEGRMSLVGVDPATGWEHRVAAHTPRRIVVMFTHDTGQGVNLIAMVAGDDAVDVQLTRTGGAGG